MVHNPKSYKIGDILNKGQPPFASDVEVHRRVLVVAILIQLYESVYVFGEENTPCTDIKKESTIRQYLGISCTDLLILICLGRITPI